MKDLDAILDAHLDGELDPATEQELLAWLAEDDKHIGEWVAATHLHLAKHDWAINQMLPPPNDPKQDPKPGKPPQGPGWVGGATLPILGLVLLLAA